MHNNLSKSLLSLPLQTNDFMGFEMLENLNNGVAHTTGFHNQCLILQTVRFFLDGLTTMPMFLKTVRPADQM